MKNIIGMVKNSVRVYKGFRTLKFKSRTPDFAYSAMRKLFVQTSGNSNNFISFFIRRRGYNISNPEGILGIKSDQDLELIVKDIEKNGFHIFEQKLSGKVINSIVDYAKKTPCRYRVISGPDSKHSKVTFSNDILFDENKPQSPVYQFSQKDIIACPELQKLVFDQSLLLVAQKYLKTRPIMDLIAMWWSIPFEGKGKSEAAQMYHFDLDRIKFIKFFFYLTDVDAETGPHCYVRGSHKKLFPSLKRDGRFTDEEVENAFGKNNLLELCGRKGTIMAVDTRGLHKGKDLVKDKRLIFQIEFANSLFGQYYQPFTKPALPQDLENVFNLYQDTYNGIMN